MRYVILPCRVWCFSILGPRSTPRGGWKALDGVRRSWGLWGVQPNSLSFGRILGGKCLGCRIFGTIPSTTLHIVGGFKHFLCSPLFGEDSHFDDHIFQRGWFNHHLVMALQLQQPPAFQVSTPRHSFWSHAWRGESMMRFMAIFVERNLWHLLTGISGKIFREECKTIAGCLDM